EAAVYDSVTLIGQALALPGTLEANLAALEDTPGVQGILRPSQLTHGEISDNVAVIRLNGLGGTDVVARFAGNTRLEQEPGGNGGVLQPTPTATLDGVYVHIISNVQNVRTGPGTEYEALGQVQKDDLIKVIGANLDFSWVVIEFRGQQGWLSTASNLLEVLGDRSTVPVVASPPTPTPPPATGLPPSSPNFPDIVITAASPVELPYNSSTNINVTVKNAGGVNAGPFAVAASFPPNSFYSALNFPSLAAGAEQSFLLPITTTAQTGYYDTIIVADLNQQVDEGQAGEANNSAFHYKYRVDRPSLTNSTTMTSGSVLDMDFNGVADINFNASGLNSNGGCNGSAYCIGMISPALTWDTAHYDVITFAGGVNTNSILSGSLTPGTTIGVLTDSGKRAVIRVDAINPGATLTITYRTY
ncbi:MAG TPA: CARDB domain-containing protein, partial [Phototrophicaceae bacterium]|nr:CARDB domain-containing protein [Phototrophicaceae bacterium]